MGSNSVTRATRAVATARSNNTLMINPKSIQQGQKGDFFIESNALLKVPEDLTKNKMTVTEYQFDDISDAPFEVGVIVDESNQKIPLKYVSVIERNVEENTTDYFTSEHPNKLTIHDNAFKAMKNNTFIHNHPEGYSSFSPNDLLLLAANPKELQIRHPTKTSGFVREIAKSKINIPQNIQNKDLQSIFNIASEISRDLPQNAYKLSERIYRTNDNWGDKMNQQLKPTSQKNFTAKTRELMRIATYYIWELNKSLSTPSLIYLAQLATNRFYAQKYGYNHELFEVK